jgi:ABC-type multidrug transport system ATPase subunit
MTVDEAQSFFCAYHKVGPRRDLLERLGIAASRRTQCGQLSVGQQRRLTLAVAMAHDRAAGHPRHGRAEKLADRTAILLRGEIAALGTSRQLTAAGMRRTRVSVATEYGRLLG